jgi:hypothetical protein
VNKLFLAQQNLTPTVNATDTMFLVLDLPLLFKIVHNKYTVSNSIYNRYTN